MTYQDFINRLEGELPSILPADSTVSIESIKKNNDITLRALIIQDKESNIFPTIYLEDFYKKFLETGDFPEICRNIIDVYGQYRISENVDVSFFEDYERVKERIVYRLVNRSKNSSLLSEIPWRPFLDLAIVYHIWIESPAGTHGSVLIKNEHLRTWKVTERDLYNRGRENTTTLLGHDLSSLPEFFNNLVGEVITTDLEASELLYVLTNKNRTYGAACMLDEGVLRDFSGRFDTDVFILPSSIHEVMLLADDGHTNITDLTKLVDDVNNTQLDPTEMLSNHAYLYLRKEGRIIY